MKRPVDKFYQRRAYFTSFTNAYPFLEVVRARAHYYVAHQIAGGGYMVSWGY